MYLIKTKRSGGPAVRRWTVDGSRAESSRARQFPDGRIYKSDRPPLTSFRFYVSVRELYGPVQIHTIYIM
jgi:hypothetical protein